VSPQAHACGAMQQKIRAIEDSGRKQYGVFYFCRPFTRAWVCLLEDHWLAACGDTLALAVRELKFCDNLQFPRV